MRPSTTNFRENVLATVVDVRSLRGGKRMDDETFSLNLLTIYVWIVFIVFVWLNLPKNTGLLLMVTGVSLFSFSLARHNSKKIEVLKDDEREG